MTTISLLGAVLLLEAQALSLGAPVEQHIEATQSALLWHIEMLAESVRPTKPPSIPPSPLIEKAAAPPESVQLNDWDPETHDAFMDASQCRALLLEVIRRSAHDWVLYRNTRKPERVYAMEAYIWLFEEKPGHPWWELRQLEGEPFLSFLNVCEVLDLDPDVVRARVREMTIRDITGTGRPAERRRLHKEYPGVEDFEFPTELDISALEGDGFGSVYEAHFAVG